MWPCDAVSPRAWQLPASLLDALLACRDSRASPQRREHCKSSFAGDPALVSDARFAAQRAHCSQPVRAPESLSLPFIVHLKSISLFTFNGNGSVAVTHSRDRVRLGPE